MSLATLVSLLWPPVLAATIATLVTAVVGPLAVRLASAVGAFDRPGGRKKHERDVPRLGGMAIALGILFGCGFVILFKWTSWSVEGVPLDALALGLGVGMIFLVGTAEDIVGTSALARLAVQIAAASLVVKSGWSFSVLALPGLGDVSLGYSGDFVTIIWIVGVTNAINFIDGLDGLASGVVAIIALSLLIYALMRGDLMSAVILASVFGACIGFLRHNWQPARLFMGDSGSLTLGFLLGATTVHSSIKSPAAVAILVPILAMGLPVMDTLFVMGGRFLRKTEKSLFGRTMQMFRADRIHIHHILQMFSSTRTGAVKTIYVLVVIFCFMALFVALTKNYKLGLVLILVEGGVVVLIRSLSFQRIAERLARRRKKKIPRGIRRHL